jgi:ABC-type multidrug transport system fused ATPase/permease subunit
MNAPAATTTLSAQTARGRCGTAARAPKRRQLGFVGFGLTHDGPGHSGEFHDQEFRGHLVLDGVTLTIAPGEVVALMGANGAGKSTLVKILAGVLPPDSGSMTVAGKVTRIAGPAVARRAGIVSVHQSVVDAGIGAQSVAENLLLDEICSARFPFC